MRQGTVGRLIMIVRVGNSIPTMALLQYKFPFYPVGLDRSAMWSVTE